MHGELITNFTATKCCYWIMLPLYNFEYICGISVFQLSYTFPNTFFLNIKIQYDRYTILRNKQYEIAKQIDHKDNLLIAKAKDMLNKKRENTILTDKIKPDSFYR